MRAGRGNAVSAESHDEFHEIAGTCIEIILETDLEQTIEYVSPEIETFLGYGLNEIIGKKLNNLVILSDLPKVDDAFQVALSGEDYDCLRIRLKSKYGEIIQLEAELIPINGVDNIEGIHVKACILTVTDG